MDVTGKCWLHGLGIRRIVAGWPLQYDCTKCADGFVVPLHGLVSGIQPPKCGGVLFGLFSGYFGQNIFGVYVFVRASGGYPCMCQQHVDVRYSRDPYVFPRAGVISHAVARKPHAASKDCCETMPCRHKACVRLFDATCFYPWRPIQTQQPMYLMYAQQYFS